MRALLIWIAAAFVFGSLYTMTAQNEALRRDGQTVYLPLATVYSRPTAEGDCLSLNYEITNALAHDRYEIIRSNKLKSGLLVIRLDSQNVGEFIRYYQGGELAPREHLLKFDLNRWRVVIGTESYRIPKASPQDFANAAYSELKIGNDGTPLIVALCDSERRRLAANGASKE